MKYPCLVPKRLCRTDIHVHLESEDTDNRGHPEKVVDLDLKCNFQDRAKTILTTEKKLVQITGTALFPGDIAPDFPTLSGGTITVFGEERRIEQLTQAAVTALEMTAEALHTEVVQAQVMPFETGNLQNENTFVDYSESKQGKVTLVSSTPYARRLYYHPEYNFQTDENPFAGGEWYEPWLPGGVSQDFARNAFKRFYKKAGGV